MRLISWTMNSSSGLLRQSFKIKAIVNSVFNSPSGTAESSGDVKQTLKDGGDGVKGLKAGRRNSSSILHRDLSQLRQRPCQKVCTLTHKCPFNVHLCVYFIFIFMRKGDGVSVCRDTFIRNHADLQRSPHPSSFTGGASQID